ncbi:dipeptide epimerase [Paracnuella aquatica]|uniref:dipeptide epimerase n=1 Tax=Paracnuella aquatica TaxID=2268757 RepID=UPI000DEEEE81|nr:dipeptide epimerase [Paracnuella aquatica]RPD51387.1 dipeptide epimerase [Paracnuella aquatica]
MKLYFESHQLPFRHPFTISKGTKTHQPTMAVRLDHLGWSGYGEAPAIAYYNITVERMELELQRKKLFVEKFAFTEPERYWHYLHHLMPVNPFLVAALDIAGWDLFGQMKGQPLSSLWQIPALPQLPQTSYTIGIDTPEKMVEKIKEKPWPVYKIKLGTDNDLAIMEAVRASTDARLRVDANAAWTAGEALEKIKVLAQMGVELVEQPLAKDDWEGSRMLRAESLLPIFADESCVGEKDVETCAPHFHGINIKLTKCSGITPALRMIEAARNLGLKVMMGSMNESTIGTAALAHLAPLVDFLDADGPLLLAEDLAEGLQFKDGYVTPSDAPGLGLTGCRF